MSKRPDLSLPTILTDSVTNIHCKQYALYFLCEIHNTDTETYRQTCGEERRRLLVEDEWLHLPPRAKFPDQSLRTIIEYHLQIASQGNFNGGMFVVCVYPESTTALLVSLLDSVGYSEPGIAWVDVDKVDSLLCGLTLGTVYWKDVEMSGRIGPKWPESHPITIQRPDLSLPKSVLEPDSTGKGTLIYAYYALCEISAEDLEAYRRKCLGEYFAPGEGEEEDDNDEYDPLRLPPRANFPAQSLREVIDYHLELVRGGEFNPYYFAVCVYPNSTTALVVTLDGENELFKPDLMWVGLAEVGGVLAGLGIANTDWFEARETYDKGGPQWPGAGSVGG